MKRPRGPPAQLRAGPLVRPDAPDAADVAIPAARHRPDIDRPSATDDPTEDQSRQCALRAAPPFRMAPAPFLRLVIPDPFETRAALEFHNPPPDADPPVSCPAVPPKPAPPAK